ncbi:hypothetical protein HOLleu_15421 [Holothuria leucospilota]|uniref:Ig-like domain-containing protein n=1 Tax=Holothuria leucospilota TaxID=206669 RepID=A0A9Q1CA30_HOLLE|nr:hypothetical protein HOLleu_15421 [Holothuria leucospilota]
MHIFNTFGVFLFLSAAIFQEPQKCISQLIVNIQVFGRYVVKTGIRNYTIGARTDINDVIISCSSAVTLPATISLSTSNGSIIKQQVTSGNGITLVEKSLQHTGTYRCLLEISKRITNDSYVAFAFTTEVDIRREENSVICGSSAGYSGYIGEIAILRCMSVYSSYRCAFEGSPNNAERKILDKHLPGRTCRCRSQERSRSCRIRRLQVVESTYLYIITTVNLTQSNTSVIEFMCISTPPRLMYWKVFGSYGNLLDIDDLNKSIKVNTTVSITQSPGETSLRIWEATPAGDDIHMVMCSTYDTEAHVVAHLRVTSKSETSSDCSLSNLEPTETHIRTLDNSITTTEGTTILTGTNFVKRSQDFGVDTKGRNETRTYSSNNYASTAVVGVPLLVTNLILIMLLFYVHRKNRKNMEINTEASAQSTEVELHDNPAYLAFREVNDCIPANGSVERECTYTNL